MQTEEILQIFKDCNALLEGHFKLSSGLHSAKYLQCAKVLQYPQICEKLCKILAAKLTNIKIDIVVGPAMGGVITAYELARQLNAPGIFTERVDGIVTLRRGFSIPADANCLISEDVVTTGKSTKEVIELIKASKANVSACSCLIDRSGGAADLGAPLFSLAAVRVETFVEANCPMCKAGLPLEKPGSRVFK